MCRARIRAELFCIIVEEYTVGAIKKWVSFLEAAGQISPCKSLMPPLRRLFLSINSSSSLFESVTRERKIVPRQKL